MFFPIWLCWKCWFNSKIENRTQNLIDILTSWNDKVLKFKPANRYKMHLKYDNPYWFCIEIEKRKTKAIGSNWNALNKKPSLASPVRVRSIIKNKNDDDTSFTIKPKVTSFDKLPDYNTEMKKSKDMKDIERKIE